MPKLIVSLIFLAFGLALGAPAIAHDLVDANGRPIQSHQHVWRQQNYGQDYRQGHSVDNSLGSIIIWSPNEYQGYRVGSNVRFARPTMRIGKPKQGSLVPQLQSPRPETSRRGSR